MLDSRPAGRQTLDGARALDHLPVDNGAAGNFHLGPGLTPGAGEPYAWTRARADAPRSSADCRRVSTLWKSASGLVGGERLAVVRRMTAAGGQCPRPLRYEVDWTLDRGGRPYIKCGGVRDMITFLPCRPEGLGCQERHIGGT